ncbi:MAG: chemotaxis protein CheW [Planctomycetota bacterium]
MTNDESSISRTDAAAIARVRALLDRPLSTQDVAENTELVAAPAESRRGAERSILVFRRGDELLAIEAAAAHRVVRASPVRRVPHRTNAVFAGLANVGGDLMPVADLGAALGMAGARTDAPCTHYIVVGPPLQRWAFGVDEVLGVRRIDEARLLPPPATVRHAADGCTAHLAPLDGDGTRASVLDAAKLALLFARSLT